MKKLAIQANKSGGNTEYKLFGMSKAKLMKNIFLTIMLVYPLTQFLVFFVYMNFNNIMLAFKAYRTDGSTYWVWFENFKNVFIGIDAELIRISFFNNLTMFFITWFIGMPLNILFGYYLYKKKFGHGVIRIIYMLPNMVSGVVMSLLFMKLIENGLPTFFRSHFDWVMPNLIKSNEYAFGVQVFYSLWLGFSSSIIIYSNAMFSIDEGIIEAGRIDGTTPITELCLIVVPMIFPTLSTYIITGVASIFTLSGSLYLFYGLNDVPHDTYMMGFYMFKIAMVGDLTAYPQASAMSVLITVVTVPLTLLFRAVLDRIDPMRDANSRL